MATDFQTSIRVGTPISHKLPYKFPCANANLWGHTWSLNVTASNTSALPHLCNTVFCVLKGRPTDLWGQQCQGELRANKNVTSPWTPLVRVSVSSPRMNLPVYETWRKMSPGHFLFSDQCFRSCCLTWSPKQSSLQKHYLVRNQGNQRHLRLSRTFREILKKLENQMFCFPTC